MSVSVSQLLMLYGWFVLAALTLILGLIARFYAKFSGERTYYPFFLFPLGLYGIAAMRYASVDRIAGDGIGDLAMALAGLTLLALSARLYWQMTLHTHGETHE